KGDIELRIAGARGGNRQRDIAAWAGESDICRCDSRRVHWPVEGHVHMVERSRNGPSARSRGGYRRRSDVEPVRTKRNHADVIEAVPNRVGAGQELNSRRSTGRSHRESVLFVIMGVWIDLGVKLRPVPQGVEIVGTLSTAPVIEAEGVRPARDGRQRLRYGGVRAN